MNHSAGDPARHFFTPSTVSISNLFYARLVDSKQARSAGQEVKDPNTEYCKLAVSAVVCQQVIDRDMICNERTVSRYCVFLTE